jgi:hypothetical protein
MREDTRWYRVEAAYLRRKNRTVSIFNKNVVAIFTHELFTNSNLSTLSSDLTEITTVSFELSKSTRCLSENFFSANEIVFVFAHQAFTWVKTEKLVRPTKNFFGIIKYDNFSIH